MAKARPARRSRAVLILSAYPRRPAAEWAAKRLVEERVLACATVLPGGRAFYVWNGRSHADPSTLLFAKTTASRAREAVRRIRETHPDRVPEILVFDVKGGEESYLAWIEESVR